MSIMEDDQLPGAPIGIPYPSAESMSIPGSNRRNGRKAHPHQARAAYEPTFTQEIFDDVDDIDIIPSIPYFDQPTPPQAPPSRGSDAINTGRHPSHFRASYSSARRRRLDLEGEKRRLQRELEHRASRRARAVPAGATYEHVFRDDVDFLSPGSDDYQLGRRDVVVVERDRDTEAGLQRNTTRGHRRRSYLVEVPTPPSAHRHHIPLARAATMSSSRRIAAEDVGYSSRRPAVPSPHIAYAPRHVQYRPREASAASPVTRPHHESDSESSSSTDTVTSYAGTLDWPETVTPSYHSRHRSTNKAVTLVRLSSIQYKSVNGNIRSRELPESKAMKHGRLRASAIPKMRAAELARISLVTHFDDGGNLQYHSLKVKATSFMNLLRESGKYKIHSSFEGGFCIFTEPFVDIFCRRDALRQHVRDFKAAPRNKSSIKDAVDCAQVVLDLLDGDFTDLSRRFDLYRAVDPPSEISFDDLWIIYPPGSLVFVQLDGQPPCAVMVDSVRYNVPTYDLAFDLSDSANQNYPLVLFCWYLDYHTTNGDYDGKFGRRSHRAVIQPFEGKRQILQLNYVPAALFKDNGVKEQVKKSGQIFWKLAGPSFREVPKLDRAGRPTMERERVMVDPPSEPKSLADGRMRTGDDDLDTASNVAVAGVPEDSPQRVAIDDLEESLPSLREYDCIDPSSEPTETMLLLCASWVRAFSLREKIWSRYEVGKLEPVQFQDNAWSRLVINQEYKDVVQAMVNSHLRGSDTFNDLIPGKGGGVVILLHGPPGVGKTLTAESVAENVRKPLYMVTAGDLGTDPEHLESKLSNIFKLATKWDAILLLDEADVFLQDRDYENLIRNALVSIFLRTLEYFKGIMFLTSNRVGAFDQAFQSRIHITLGIPEFNAQVRREVWRIFLTDLGRKRRDGAAPLLTHEECRSLGREVLQSWASKPINGRQIRNCVRSALALAQDKNQKVAAEHFNTVIELGDMFTKYLNRLQKAEVDEVAQIKGDRLADMRSLVAQCKAPATNSLRNGVGNGDDNAAPKKLVHRTGNRDGNGDVNGAGEHSP